MEGLKWFFTKVIDDDKVVDDNIVDDNVVDDNVVDDNVVDDDVVDDVVDAVVDVVVVRNGFSVEVVNFKPVVTLNLSVT